MIPLLFYSQPYSVLLKNTDWTIMKIQWNSVDYLAPFPFEQSGKADFKYDNSNGFKSSFFNTAVGTVDFGPNNGTYFNAQISAITLVEYNGVNEQLVNQFDNLATSFYAGFQPTDQFTFEYEEIFSGKNLIVTNPLGNKIFYSNLLLKYNELSSIKEISIYPNPAKDEFFLKSSNKNLRKLIIEIYDASGKLVTRQKISANDSVNTRALPNGVYTVKVDAIGLNYSSKIRIEK